MKVNIKIMKAKLSSFILQRGDCIIPLRLGSNIIRRQQGIGSRFTSKYHCEVYVKEKGNKELVILFDKSLNGTYLNNTYVKGRGVFLQPMDVIGLGSFVNPFHLQSIDVIVIED